MTSKGQALENELYACLRNLVATGLLGFTPGTAEVYQRKKYYSADRNALIETDVSLEFTVPGADSPALLWVWECKDYSRPVSVGTLEQFDSVLQQLGANKTKGTIVTRSSYSKTAIQYARSRGIGLARVVARDRLVFVLHNVVGMPSADELAISELLMSDQSESRNTGAGVAADGRLLIHGEFDNGLPDCIVDQLHVVLASARDLNGKCLLCGKDQTLAAADIKFRAKATDQEAQEAGLVRRELSLWRSFALCRACALLIVGLPRLGQFRYAMALFLLFGGIALLGTGVVALFGSSNPLLVVSVVLVLAAIWRLGKATTAVIRTRRLQRRARSGAGLGHVWVLCDADVAFGLGRLSSSIPEGRSYKHDYTSFRPLSTAPLLQFRVPSRGEQILQMLVRSRAWREK